MVFFDDKANNCFDCRKAGVTSVCTDQGLTWPKFVQCLTDFEAKHTGSTQSTSSSVTAKTPIAAAARSCTAPASQGAWASIQAKHTGSMQSTSSSVNVKT